MKLSLDYIAGLIDADGSFSISIASEQRGKKRNYSITVGPTINFRQLEIYKSTLKAIQKKLSAGKIYRHSGGGRFKMLTWQTTSQKEALRTAKKLYPYLKIKKQICKKFIEAIEFWNNKVYIRKIARYKHQLRRPFWVIEKMIDYALNLNKNNQTETTYKKKKQRYEILKNECFNYYSKFNNA